MTLPKIAIIAACRSPIGTLGGELSTLPALQIGAQTIKAALRYARIEGAQVDETILGQVLTAGVGMNPARQAARAAGIHDAAPAMTINQVCGSGLRAVALAAQQIQTGCANIVVAGGQENMSMAPHVATLRAGKKLGDISLSDSVMRDGLTDAFHGYPMGNTAENVADKCDISRADQDAFALLSQHKAQQAVQSGYFDAERIAIEIETRKGINSVSEDGHIRPDVDLAGLTALRPVFAKKGSVTAGNSSGINDGAAALVLMTADQARSDNISPLAIIKSFAHTGLDPAIMGLGPISASQCALKKAGWSVGEVDLWEINEAFAAQSLAVMRALNVEADRVNIHGGAIALGHPIGASGARILTTLIHAMARRDVTRGVATLCIGGGMGIAMCVERI